jgi:hypothetical protein
MRAPSLLGQCADRLARTTLMGSADRKNHLAGRHPSAATTLYFPDNREWNREFLEVSPHFGLSGRF